ncbi:response regulator [Streptomyces sp. NPDC092296]|uniref:response regulator n=1 Tax=Streptomyces sp. NPDC092296 TaxID=3366012 RepID=UPI00382F7E86
MTTAPADAFAGPRHRSPDRCAPAPATGVLLADGHHLFRSGLSALLDRERDLTVVAETARGEDAVAEAARTRPSVAVVDLDVPGPGGPATAAQIRERAAGTAVLLLAALPRTVELQRALVGGVEGILLKDVPPGVLLSAVRELACGGRVYDPRLVMDAVRGRAGTPTPRELAVLRHIAAGSTINEAAGAMRLSPGTVRNYVSSVIAKTEARNRCDAIRIARERGWL